MNGEEDKAAMDSTAPRRRAIVAFAVAAAPGLIHAGFSFYWSAGGNALVWSLGTDLVESLRGRRWLLIPVGALKLAGAVVPLLCAWTGWPLRRLTRGVCWLGAVVLIGWGGVNTVTANLVLAGAVRPGQGFDRPGMIGHAFLWDPLFLAWGVALALGLLATRRTATHPGGPAVEPTAAR